jgi:acyl-CoA thioesterase I
VKSCVFCNCLLTVLPQVQTLRVELPMCTNMRLVPFSFLLVAALSRHETWPPQESLLAPFAPTCRIKTDSFAWEHNTWRNAYTTLPSGDITTHKYAFCSNGKGPWTYTKAGVSVDECASQCKALDCKCFDYFCQYHPASNCSCPSMRKVTPYANATKVACVGDSITAGYLSSCELDYPNQLQRLLGEQWNVRNFGVGGTTLLRRADHPYVNTSAYSKALAFEADIVVIMLGTNDAKRSNWRLASQFLGDYQSLIGAFKATVSKPAIYVMKPPPLYRDRVYYDMNQSAINTALPRLVDEVARASLLPSAPIDLFDLFQQHCPVENGMPGHPPSVVDVPCDWIASGGTDACHPNDEGYGKIAQAVLEAII